MTKPPAFQFYADDFLAGTGKFSDAEVGLYIRLLCAQWSEGGLPDNDEELASYGKGGTPLARVKAKFQKGEDGLLRQPRMEIEREKQRLYRESRAANGKHGGRPHKPHGFHVVSQDEAQPKHSESSPSPSPSSNSLEREQGAERPDEREVKAHAVTIGLAEWKALDWFNEMEACGWLDHVSRPVKLWKPLLARVKAKWEADGRPAGPPASKAYQAAPGANGAQREPSTYELRTRLEEVRKAKQSAKGKAAQAPGGGLIFSRDEDKNEFLRLGRLEKELAAKLIAA